MNDVTKAFGAVLKNSKQQIADLADLLLRETDAVGVLEKVPFLGVAVKIYSVVNAYDQYRLRRNVEEFLRTISQVPTDHMADAWDEIQSDPRHGDEIADTLLTTLIESAKPLRARFAAKLITYRSLGKMTNDELDKLLQITQTSPLPCLVAIAEFFESNNHCDYSQKQISEQLEGLVSATGLGMRTGAKFTITALGSKFYEACYDHLVSYALRDHPHR
jgi:hypothetical protein